MRVLRLMAFICVLVAMGSHAQAVVILDYDLTGATTTAPDDWAPTTQAPGISGILLTRGAGIDPSGLTNGFSSNNWATAEASLANAISANEYYEWGFSVDPGYEASLSTFDVSLRRSAVAAPMNYALYASLDGFASSVLVVEFSYFGRSSGTAPPTIVPYQWMTTDTAGQNAGNPISTVDLSTTPQLQDLQGGTSVTFRLYAWGNGDGASSNTVALGRVDGPEIGGEVIAIPEPASVGLLTVGSLLLARRRR
jgi:hypothetical protein